MIVPGQGAFSSGTDIPPATCKSFIPLQTLSGKSLGSLKQYQMDWNAVDTSEVTSQHTAVLGQLAQQIADLPPAAPGRLFQKMHAAKVALEEANKVVVVSSLCSFCMHLYNLMPGKDYSVCLSNLDVSHPPVPEI